jgi:hypothetical protein
MWLITMTSPDKRERQVQPNVNRRDDARRGVALIIVLGFLSIMILMAVAFLTNARTERMVADSSLEAMRGRQLVRTALNAAMNDYSRALDSAKLIMPVTEPQRMFLSRAKGNVGNQMIGQEGIEPFRGEAEEWIPAVYKQPPFAGAEKSAQWIAVRENPASSSSRILGRYAYICLDMSGGIDANLSILEPEVAGHDARVSSNRVRRSVRQVPVRLLPEVQDVGKFKQYRSGWKGFDSLQSLIKLTDGKPNDGNVGSSTRWHPDRKEYGAALASNLVSDLSPFSLSVFRGGRYLPGSGTWTPYHPCWDSDVWTDMISDLEKNVGNQFANKWKDWIESAIYDYTHDLPVPTGLDYPSPKNVPMFNEMALSCKLVETAGAIPGSSEYELQATLTFEFWYPFPSEDNKRSDDYQLSGPSFGGGPATDGDKNLWARMRLRGEGGTVEVELGDVTPSPSALQVPAQYNNGKPYLALDRSDPTPGAKKFTYTFPIVRTAGNTNPLPSGMALQVPGVVVQKPIYLLEPNGPIEPNGPRRADMIPRGVGFSAMALRHGEAPVVQSRAVTDPRLNHLRGEWKDEEPATLGEMNNWFTPQPPRAYLEEGGSMYCRNGPMETPAELGFISVGENWQTIDICRHDALDMLAFLVADTNLYYGWQANKSAFYTNGTINPNTRSSNVLMSAFVDLSTHEVPNLKTSLIPADPVDEDMAELIAKQILETTKSGKIDEAFQVGTDWAKIPAMQKNGALAKGYGLNNNQRESLIRNTWGLFNPENSMFTVLVIAQTIKEGPHQVGIWGDDDLVTGERRLVALVWRDPFKTGKNLHHEMFVKMIRYLND